MDDDSKFFSQTKETNYSVLFSNKDALSKYEIRNIFNEWGTVFRVVQAGDERGHRFVVYNSEAEVRRCIQGLKNHPRIKLLPLGGQHERSRSKQRNLFPVITKPINSKSRSPKAKVEENSASPFSLPPINHRLERGTQNHLPEREIQNHAPEREIQNHPPEREIQNFPETKNTSMNSLSIEKKESAEVQKGLSKQIFSSEPIKLYKRDEPEISNSSIAQHLPYRDLKIPDLVLISDPKQEQYPFGSSANGHSIKNEKYETYNAKLVLIANFPSYMSQHSILHLVKNYHPLCITPMRFIEALDLRYCVVYFPSNLLATQVETDLDNMEIGFRHLIILRFESLCNFSKLH